jgi:5-methylcytosine-specific restriction endonuclease McrA
MVATRMKVCADCQNPKPMSEFNDHMRTDDGKHQYCKSCNAERCREYKKSPKGKAVQALSNVRSKRRQAEKKLEHPIKDTLTSTQIAMVQAFSDECFYCRKDLTPSTVTIDHCKPFSAGGTNEFHNLLPACKSCNSRKGNRPILEFLREHVSERQTDKVIFQLAQRQRKTFEEMKSELESEVSV